MEVWLWPVLRAAKRKKIIRAADITNSMRWDVLEALDTRMKDGRIEVLVHWACSWISDEDYRSGRLGLTVQAVDKRSVGDSNQVLVQWACTWVPADDVDEELVAEVAEPAAVTAAEPKPKKRRKHAVRGW